MMIHLRRRAAERAGTHVVAVDVDGDDADVVAVVATCPFPKSVPFDSRTTTICRHNSYIVPTSSNQQQSIAFNGNQNMPPLIRAKARVYMQDTEQVAMHCFQHIT